MMKFHNKICPYLRNCLRPPKISFGFFVQETKTPCSQNVVTNEEDVLSDEERNSRCCAQKLNCCNKRSEPTNFEVRALLLKCNDDAKKHASNTSISLAYSKKRSVKTGEPRCSDDDETVKSCRKKIKLTIKIRNMGITNSKNQYILIDHVFDSVTSKKQKLQNPYVLKIKQFPILQTYGLSYESMVNLEAKEKVHNKYEQGYSGCNVDPSSPNPSCGSIKYKNEAIPFSTGFCCSCDDKQQTDNSNISGTSNITNRRSDKSSIDGTVGISNAGGGKVQADLNPSNDGSYSRYVRLTNENQLMDFEGKPGVYQKRGGQDCSDKSTPPTANPETYHQSAHCLEFSDVWYSVYHLDAPKVYHLLAIQIFEKNQESIDGGCKWRDLTKKTAIYIGTDVLHYTNEQNSIAMNYFASKKNKGTGYALNHKIHKLLIPDTTNIDPEKHQEVAGGPSEYLVIKEHQARTNGKSCNVAGVGYEAFAKQPNRCAMPQGSCLKNQPKQMWLHDHEAEENGKKGCYFLKFYGLLPLNPIQINTTTQNKTLRLYHTEHYTSIVDMEIKADENVILRPNTLVALTEAYVESTHLQKTSLIAKVFNTGLVSGVFMVSLTDCPLNLPASFSNINSKPVLIPPQRQHVFNLDIECALPVTDFFCSLQVLNVQHEILAVRKIRLRKQDRCFCMWYCYCSCLIADKYLKCNPLTLDEYRMAGFQGSLPMPLHVVQYTFMDDMMATMFLVLLILCLALLVLGLIKAIVGFFMVPVGEWGFDVILDLPKKIDTYYENDLNHRSVSYDSKGWPRHPDTGKRVRNIQFSAEFCINLVFFVIYPFALIWLSLRRFCCRPQETRPSYDSFGSCHCKNGTMVQRKSSTLQSALVKVRTESIE